MYGIRINDMIPTERGGFLSFDTYDILAIVGHRVHASQWRCRYVECMGRAAAELHAISDHNQVISGDVILRITSQIDQTIEGDFEAYHSDHPDPWLIIRAVDSSWFEVWSDDQQILTQLKARFTQVSDLESEQ